MSFLSSLMQSVRVRTLVVLCAVVVAVLACLGWWTHRVLGQSFEQLEAAEEFQFTWNMIITVIAVTGGIIAVAVAIIFEVGVHARLIRLSKDLAEIAQTNDQVSLVYAGGTDEIGRLGMEINRLLASQRGWREQISRRNASMRLIFDTLPIGLLSVDTLGRIQPDRSSATAELLGRPDLEGLDLGDLLVPGSSNLTTRRRLSDYLAIVRGGTIDAVGLDEVNPLKTVTVQRANGPIVLRLHFYSLENSTDARRPPNISLGVVESSGVLVTFTDISDERRLAAEAEKSQLDYQQLKAMAEDVDLFHGFLVNIRGLVKQLNELSGRMGTAPDRVQLRDMQRNIRALRSGGEIFGLATLEQAARNFDVELVRYLGMNHLSDVEVRRCRFGVADLEAAVIAVERQFRALLGSQDESAGKNIMSTSGQRGGQPRAQVDLRVSKRSTLVQLAGLLVQPARIGLAPSIRLLVPMARRRGMEVRFSVQGEEVMVGQSHLDVLNRMLPQLLRFTCDQGFDVPVVRERAGKPPAPLLSIGVERNERHVVVTVADDGGGIDPQRMRDMAVEQKILTREVADGLDDHAAQGLVFTLSHESEDETLSGVRPVGLNLIFKRLFEELNADVAIQSTLGQGTAVTISIPLSQS
jgi:PAS domain-containing protein